MKNTTRASLIMSLVTAAASAQSINWTNPAGGLWDTPANWDLGTFPTGPTESAIFNIGGSYTSTIDFSISDLGSVSILDPMCTVSTNTGVLLAVNGGIVNNGLILVNNTNGGFTSTLRFNTSNSFTGTGTVRLNGQTSRSLLLPSALQTITNGPGHTITGIGRLTGNFINDGTILSNDTSQTLAISNGGWTNNGLMEVSNDATMSISNIAMTQSPAAEILIDNGAFTMTSSSITGGTIRSMPGESWTAVSGVTELYSVNTIGDGTTSTGVLLRLFDTIENDGQITVNNTNGGFTSTIEFRNPFALNGNGSILMNGSSTRAILTTNDPLQLVTQAASHTINGFGIIRAPMINNGSIIANVGGTQLLLNTNNQINNNLYQVTNGAEMSISNISIDQTGGGVINLTDGLLRIVNSSILGGNITAATGSTLITSGTVNFDNVTNGAPLSMDTGTVLAVTNGFEHNSTLLINNSNGGFATVLLFNDSSSLTGSGTTTMNGTGSRSQLNTAVGQTMTIDGAHTVEGFGHINASLVNNGTMNSSTAGQTMLFQTNDKTNNSIISAEPGALIGISNVAINQDPSASINVGDGVLNLTSATINDGTINALSGVVNKNSGTTLFNSLILNAPVNTSTGTLLQVTNDLEINDTVTINITSGGFATILNSLDSSTLSGSGQVTLNGSGGRAQLNTQTDETVTIAAGFDVNGFGQINADLINNGTISSNFVGQTLTLQLNDKINNALISIEEDTFINVSSVEIDQTGGGQIFNNGGLLTLTNATIRGGTLDAVLDGSCTVVGTSALIDVTNLSPINTNTGTVLNLTGVITNESTISVNPLAGGFTTNLGSSAPVTILGSGEVVLGGSSTRAQIVGAGMTFGPDQTLSGLGVIAAPITVDGTIAPGFSVGEMDASAPITLSDTSTFEVEVASETSRDNIDSSSTFHADGTLDLSLIDGFSPTTAWVATIVTADMGVTGTFDTLIAPSPPTDPRLSFKIGYFENEIRVGAVCDTDFDFSGNLNFFDVSRFLELYGMQDPQADIVADGNFNFFDVSAFLANFGQSCP
ncbi:MAG: hypothetical protein AB8C13_08400 [Phycisphaerales bacterium]